MAKGKKTGGRDFQPGNKFSLGRAPTPEDLRKSRSLNRIKFERILNKYIFMSGPELNAAMKANTAPMIDMIVMKVLAKAFNEGDTRRMEVILDRLIGRPKENPEGKLQNDNSFAQKKTFEDFCTDAGYPTPYPKQIEMMEFGIFKELPRLLLGARGYGKTDYVTILGVAYDVYLNGTATSNLIISKSKSRNTAMLQEIANALKSNGVTLEKENSTALRIEGMFGKDHSVEVITIKGSLRGRHPKRIVMDDPVTEEDVSEAMRALVKRKYNEALKLCENVLVLGQPAHAFDLFAELRPILEKMEVPHGMIPELDADLEAMRLAGVDAHSIEMSYHLRVPKEGSAVFSGLRFIDKFPTGANCVAFIDPSDGGDYTAVSIMRAFGDGVVVQGHAWKKAWYLCLDEMTALFKKLGVAKVCFETNATGTQPILQLRQVLGSIGVDGKHSTTEKHSTILAAGSYSHLIHLSKESDKVYTEQVVKYEYRAKFDDAPDSLARGLEWIGLLRGKK